jgi:tetratricopeptide (TPR) repeat protein
MMKRQAQWEGKAMMPKPKATRRVLATLPVFLAMLLAGPAITRAAERAPAPKLSVALLPFAREGVIADESAPEVLYEIVSHGLQQVRAIRLLGTGAAEKALQAAGASRGAPLTDRQLAEIMGGTKARAAITGSVRQDGDGLRLALRFVEAPSRGEVGLAGEASGPAVDPFPLGERATQSLLRILKVRPSPVDEKRLAAAFRRPTQNLAAYALYAQGSWALGLDTRQGYEAATDLFGKALELDGNFALARYRLGLALQATNNRWKAVGEFRKAIQLEPTFAEAYKSLGDLLRLSPRRLYDQAIEAYSKAIDLQSDFADAYVGRGDAWQAKGNHDNAIAEYKKTIDLDPENARVRVSLGRIYYNEKGQYHEAVAEYNRAIQLDPTLLEAHLALGEVYEEKGLYQDAIGRYSKVLEIDPRHPTAHYGLALAYEKVDREKSIAMWEKYIEIASTSPTEKEWLEIARKHLKKLKEQPPSPAR